MKRILVLLLWIASPALAVEKTKVHQAIEALSRWNGFPAEDSLLSIEDGYFALPAAESLTPAQVEDLLSNQSLALWSGNISEFLSLSVMLFEESPAAQSAQNRKTFELYQNDLLEWIDAINSYIQAIHPGLTPLHGEDLMAKFKGDGVAIAVFDVFDSALLQKQTREAQGLIEAPIQFLKPLELSHGNTVIDIIRSIAPRAKIVPVWVDTKDYTKGLNAILARDDIQIVNMSRAFAEGTVKGKLDPDFKTALQNLVKKKILVKALGNTGTDLVGTVTAKRQALGLGPVNNLAGYDLSLIQDFSESEAPGDLALFAMNYSLFGNDIALSATIPGANATIQNQTFGLPAEGVWSPSTQTFESGSSFAAPQLSAILALLWEKAQVSSNERAKSLLETLKKANSSADRKDVFGLGMPILGTNI